MNQSMVIMNPVMKPNVNKDQIQGRSELQIKRKVQNLC